MPTITEHISTITQLIPALSVAIKTRTHSNVYTITLDLLQQSVQYGNGFKTISISVFGPELLLL